MCTDSTVLSVVNFILRGFDILMILVPALLIVMGSIDFFKIVTSNEGNKESKHVMAFVKRCIFAALLFFAPLIVKTCLIMVGDSSYETTFSDCIKNSSNIAYYKELEETNRAKEETNDPEEEKKLTNKETVILKNNVYDNDEYKDEESDEPEYIAPEPDEEDELDDDETVGDSAYSKYSVRTVPKHDEDLKNLRQDDVKEKIIEDLTRVCLCEQSRDGVAIEASIMANLYELKGSAYGKAGDLVGLHNYVMKGKWFACRNHYKENGYKPTDADIAAVRRVLINGDRKLPLYIDEHDCRNCGRDEEDKTKTLTDIAKIIYIGERGRVINITSVDAVNQKYSNHVTDNRILESKYYVSEKTKVYNVYGSEYTVYSILPDPDDEYDDVFGYQAATKAKYDNLNKNK